MSKLGCAHFSVLADDAAPSWLVMDWRGPAGDSATSFPPPCRQSTARTRVSGVPD